MITIEREYPITKKIIKNCGYLTQQCNKNKMLLSKTVTKAEIVNKK